METVNDIWQQIAANSWFGDLLGLASLGFVVGVLMPFAFRLVGFVLDAVHSVLYSNNDNLERG